MKGGGLVWKDEGRKEGLEEEAICFVVEEERMEKRLLAVDKNKIKKNKKELIKKNIDEGQGEGTDWLLSAEFRFFSFWSCNGGEVGHSHC
jgi:hypothetical protein